MVKKLKRCLIADDVRSSRELMRTWLTESEFECTVADDGRAAWQWIQQNLPDVVVTDIEMPGLSGLELLTAMRQSDSPQLRAIPVVVITSLRDGEVDNIVQRVGGNGLLTKPLDRRRTCDALHRLAGGEQGFLEVTSDGNHGDSAIISPTLRRLAGEVLSNEGPTEH